MLGRPPRNVPPDFPELFERHGWEARDVLGTNTRTFARLLDQAGREEMTRRRRNYVLGRRLSSVKLVSKAL